MSPESVPRRVVSPEVDGSADGIGAASGLSRFFFLFFRLPPPFPLFLLSFFFSFCVFVSCLPVIPD